MGVCIIWLDGWFYEKLKNGKSIICKCGTNRYKLIQTFHKLNTNTMATTQITFTTEQIAFLGQWFNQQKNGMGGLHSAASVHQLPLKAYTAAAQYSTISNHTTKTKSSSFVTRVSGLLKNYKQLSKFRLSGLVVATAAAGYVAASKESIQWEGLGWTSLGTMLCSSSANALNQLYEVKIYHSQLVNC